MIAHIVEVRPFQISTEPRRSATGCGSRQAAAIDDGFKRLVLIGLAEQRLHMVTS